MPVAVRRLLVVLAVAGAGLVPAPATAAGYCTGSGVNVVVDFGAIGGGVEKGCGTGSTASAVFASAGVGLTRDQQYQAVVCKVEGLPTNANCATMPAANAYWGLFWADGTSGRWVYSTVSVDALKVPSGGFVAFAWQATSSQRSPSVAPSNPRPAPSPTPTKQPTRQPTKKPSAGTTTPASATPSRSADPSTSATASATASATGSASPSASTTALPSADPSTSGPAAVGEAHGTLAAAEDTDESSLAWWVPVAVLLALAGGGGAVWWRRRRGSA